MQPDQPRRAPSETTVIVSETRFLRDSLVEVLGRTAGILVCGQAANLDDAIAVTQSLRPGTILLDVAFPGGTEAARRLCAILPRASLPRASLIALGIAETREQILAWAAAGAAGYVPNTASVDDLVTLIAQISRGEQSCPSHIAGSLLRHIAASSSRPASTISNLTCREQEIFRLIGAGLSNKDIARRLSISLGTAKSHVHNLLAKLSLQRRAEVMARVQQAAPPA